MKKPFVAPFPYSFADALLKFGHEDFFHPGEPFAPHQLQSVTCARENYLHAMFRNASDIIRYACGDNGQMTEMSTDVRAFIRSKGREAEEAFGTLLGQCRKYMASVDALAAKGGQIRINAADNGMPDAEAAQLKQALGVIWKAVPETDPRLVEGMEYVMESAGEVQGLFKNYWWRKNDKRCDYRLAERLENPQAKDDSWSSLPAVPEKRAAVARQTAENMELLKEHAEGIAAQLLAWCLSRTLKIDSDYRVFDQSRTTAYQLLDEISSGKKAIGDAAQDIRKGRHGTLLGKRAWMKNDDTREKAIVAAAGAETYLALALDVYNGGWFDARRDRLLKLADREITGAYSLHAPIRVSSPLKLKPK